MNETAKTMLNKHNLKFADFLAHMVKNNAATKDGKILFTLQDVDDFIFSQQDLHEFASMFGVSEFELCEPF